MDDKIQLLHDSLKDTYELGTIEDFYKYLQDDNNRKMFYNEVIEPMYDVESLQEFESTYDLGVKKKRHFRACWGYRGHYGFFYRTSSGKSFFLGLTIK